MQTIFQGVLLFIKLVMSTFTPISGFVGGSLIGLASTSLLLLNGDIMGASGIISPMVIQPQKTWKSQSWKFVFTASFIGTANLYLRQVDPHALQEAGLGARPLSSVGYLVAGLLVGFGTKLGNGCTSGHGICGMARLSRRSFAAVATFMSAAMATATLLAQEAFKSQTTFLYIESITPASPDTATSWLIVAVPIGLALWSVWKNPSRKTLGAAISGAFFAMGLALSKMVLPGKVLGFLDLSAIPSGRYDPTLATVMGGGLLISYIGYRYKERYSNTKPVMAEEFNVPCNVVIDWPLLLGSSLFGAGWGLGGLCPGPALFRFAVGVPSIVLLWMPAFFAGSYLAAEFQDYNTSACVAVLAKPVKRAGM